MSKITRAEIAHVAALARLKLTPKDFDRAAEQLSSILAYVGKLQTVATKDVPVTAALSGLRNVARPDQVSASPPALRDALLAAAPDREDDLLRTRGVFTAA